MTKSSALRIRRQLNPSAGLPVKKPWAYRAGMTAKLKQLTDAQLVLLIKNSAEAEFPRGILMAKRELKSRGK